METAFKNSSNLNLPVSFRPGDVLEIDCRPFQPLVRVVLLEIGNNKDCCMVQVLHPMRGRRWDVGAVKHGHVFPDHHGCDLSPLYRIAKFQGQLPENEQLLETVSRYLNADEQKGRELWEFVRTHRDDGDEIEVGAKEKNILAFLKSKTE